MQASFDMSAALHHVDAMVQALRAQVEPALGVQQALAFEGAVSEALTNIVVHGYKGTVGGAGILIELSTDGQGAQLTVRDQGRPGPSDLYETGPDLDKIDILEESGRGLALIRHHADTVNYTPSSDGNLLVLTFAAASPDLPGDDTG